MKQNMENIYNEAESEKHTLKSISHDLQTEIENAVKELCNLK